MSKEIKQDSGQILIYDEDELDKNSTCRKFRQVRKDGRCNVSKIVSDFDFDKEISKKSSLEDYHE